MSDLSVEPVRFALTRAEYVQALLRAGRLARRLPPPWPASVKLIGYLRVLTLPLLLVVGLKAFRPTVASGPVAVGFLVLVFATICFHAWLKQSAYFYRWLPRADGASLREQTVSLHDDGVEFASEVIQTRLRWPAVKAVDDHAGLILLFVDRASAMTIPRRAFADNSAADRFLAAVRSKTGTAGQPIGAEYGPSLRSKWVSRLVLAAIAVLILLHFVKWLTAGI